MRKNLIFAALLLLMMIALPVAALGFQGGGATEPSAVIVTPKQTKGGSGTQTEPESIQVVRSATGKAEEIGLAEYLIGCVAAEMPMSYHVEALKAQAVASCTYARHQAAQGKEPLSDSGETAQAYLSPDERKEKWGSNAATYEKKLGEAVASVLGQQITWEGRPILAVFHAVCSGLTEDAENYWGGEYPYLLGVASPGDRLSPDYSKTIVFSPEEIKAALKEEGVDLSGEAATWFGKAENTDAGTVQSIVVGGKTLTGQRLRALLGLRSANFFITYKDGGFSVKTVGYGHGVGMSQYGADFMARQGSGYKEILEHYYTGCTVA